MKKLSLKMLALIAAMMMCLTAEAMTEDVGGRVIDAQGEPLPFVSVALLTADSTYIQGATSDVDGWMPRRAKRTWKHLSSRSLIISISRMVVSEYITST